MKQLVPPRSVNLSLKEQKWREEVSRRVSAAGGSGTGTVTSVSITTANGVSGSVATATTTPAISLTLGAITPTTIVASSTIQGSNLSGTNTGDQDLSGKQDVLVSGTNIKTINGSSVLGAGDLVVSGSATITETEIDFGSVPTNSKTFTITDATVTATSKIMPTQSGNVATDRVGDDAEWDSITYAAKAATGTFTLTAYASGPIVGKRKVFYQVAA